MNKYCFLIVLFFGASVANAVMDFKNDDEGRLSTLKKIIGEKKNEEPANGADRRTREKNTMKLQARKELINQM